jgi:hypothetical protein
MEAELSPSSDNPYRVLKVTTVPKCVFVIKTCILRLNN